jgi:hypothetical protein
MRNGVGRWTDSPPTPGDLRTLNAIDWTMDRPIYPACTIPCGIPGCTIDNLCEPDLVIELQANGNITFGNPLAADRLTVNSEVGDWFNLPPARTGAGFMRARPVRVTEEIEDILGLTTIYIAVFGVPEYEWDEILEVRVPTNHINFHGLGGPHYPTDHPDVVDGTLLACNATTLFNYRWNIQLEANIPTVTNVTANPTTIVSIGGSSTITVAGTNLVPSSMRIAAFLNNAGSALYTRTPTGSASGVSSALTFPANTGTANRIYTVRVSVDNGATWLTVPVATVTVSAPSGNEPGLDEIRNEARALFGGGIDIIEVDGALFATGIPRGTVHGGAPLGTGSPINLPSGATVTAVIAYDVGGADNFDNLMIMMFHLFGVQPITDPARLLAAGGEPSNDPFNDLMIAMFAIFA